jgi:mRNA deadenylase 3'-5' endonuclease subunit Ccr4
MLEDGGMPAASGSDTFTVFCYNILAEKYATPQMYGYTPSWALSWEYRKELILQEILAYSADIVCLQVKFNFKSCSRVHTKHQRLGTNYCGFLPR